MTANHFLGQPELATHLPHLVLEQLAQGLEQLEGQPLRQATDVVVSLDRHRRPALRRNRLDDVRVERALHQEAHIVTDRSRLGLEHVDEGVPDPPALLLGILYAPQPLEELCAGVYDPQVDAQVTAKGRLDLLPLVQAQQSVVDEDAREAITDRPVDQHRRDR